MNDFCDNGPSITECDGFYITYMRETGGGPLLLRFFFASGDAGGEETALVKDGKFLKFRILKGDWRKEYANLIPNGWQTCLRFFDEQRGQHGSVWTSEGV